jgi:hypothetical protein
MCDLSKCPTISYGKPHVLYNVTHGFFYVLVCDIVQHTRFTIRNHGCCSTTHLNTCDLTFRNAHRSGAITADERLTHPSEDGLATPIAMVLREAESAVSAPPVSSVSDDTVI